MRRKIKIMIYAACVLWIVVFAQILITRVYVQRNDVTQAFARNQLVVEKSSTQIREVCREGGWILGRIPGKLDGDQMRRIADGIFGYEGGSCLYDYNEGHYYVAYGFTNGIDLRKKVNGRTVNMNIAITYDENEDESLVYFGVPFINGDF